MINIYFKTFEKKLYRADKYLLWSKNLENFQKIPSHKHYGNLVSCYYLGDFFLDERIC